MTAPKRPTAAEQAPTSTALAVQGNANSALAALLIVRDVPEAFLGVALGVAAGTLLAVATEDLLPEIHRRARRGFALSAACMLAGVAVVALYTFALGVHG